MIKLSGLSPCLVILSVIFVCYQSVIRNSNNISGYVYNREFINQLTPVSHSPSKFKFWIRRLNFFLKLMFLVVSYQKYFNEYNLCYLQSRCLQSFISKLFINISSLWKKGPWCDPCLKLYKILPQHPWPTGLYSPVAPLMLNRNIFMSLYILLVHSSC